MEYRSGVLFVLAVVIALLSLPAASQPSQMGPYGHGRMHMGWGVMGGPPTLGANGFNGMHMGWGMMGGPQTMGPMVRPGMMNPMANGHMGMLSGVWALDLSSQQRGEIRNLRRQLRDAHWARMKNFMEASDRLEELYPQWPLPVEKIDAAYKDLFAARRSMIMEQLKFQNDVYEKLTPEQRQQLEQMMMFGAGSGDGSPQ